MKKRYINSPGNSTKGGKSRWYLNRYLYLIVVLIIVVGVVYYFLRPTDNKAMNNINEKVTQMEEYNKAKDYEKLEAKAEEILELKPEDTNIKTYVLQKLVFSESIKGKLEEAAEHAKMLVEVEPKSGHYILGLIYSDLKKYDLAKEELQKAKDLNAEYENIDSLLRELEKATQ